MTNTFPARVEPILFKPPPLAEAHFYPMGLGLRVASNSPAILAAAEAAFGGFGPPPSTASPDLRFCFLTQPEPVAGLEPLTFSQTGELVYRTAGPGATLMADRARGAAYGYFSPASLVRSTFFRREFLELALFTMLEPRGLMGVHGAALVKQGRALLLRTPSGGGKTTLAYAWARRGWQLLAEDVVWLAVDGQRWWGMPWHLHLLPDASRLFPELQGVEPGPQPNGELKMTVHLEERHRGSTIVSARPGPVVLIERRPGGRSRLAPVDQATAWSLWQVGAAGTEQSFPAYERHVKALLRANSYRLFLGDDLDTALVLLERLL